ncbi:MAG: transcriptional repressor NrdR [Polynucleobacter sp.]|jgi:transcriptional repressor NrdR|nr:transcriptional repressor NrdR [Polynucleobacter sp.]
MRCPFCHSEDTQVMDTRVSDEGDSVRRRRRCASCDKRFTTYERAELNFPAIVKKNGSRVDYSHEKLAGSIRLALRKRPVSADMVEDAIGRIEEKLMASGEKEVPSERVGELVMRELKRLDKVAYIRFASVYRSFADIESFESALKELK